MLGAAQSIRRYRWWGVLGIIMLVAATLRFSGYLFDLPYYDDMDEPWLYYEAVYQRGLLPDWLHPNPSPGLISLYVVGQVASEVFAGQSAIDNPAGILAALRFVCIIASLLTIVFIALSARLLAGDKAGWLAALIWTLIPLVIYHSFIAIAEPWMMLFVALALYFAARTLRSDNPLMPVASVWAGLLAFAFKYSMFPFAGIGVALVLWRLWGRPAQRRAWLRTLGYQVVSIVAFLAFLVVFSDLGRSLTNPNREIAVFLDNPLARLADVGFLADTLAAAFRQFGLPVALFALVYIGALVQLLRVEHDHDREALWLLFGALGTFSALLVPLYLMIDVTRERYLFAASLTFTILAAASCALIFDRIVALLKDRRWRPVLIAIAGMLVVIWLAPLAAQAVAEARERVKPLTLRDLTIWATNTLGPGGIIAEGAASRAFSREMGGYAGDYRERMVGVDILSRTPEEWLQDGYRYVEMVGDYVEVLASSAEGQAYLSQLQELRRFPPPESTEAWSGLSFVVFQFQRPQVATAVVFGDTLRLIGYDGLPDSASPGDEIGLRFYWQALRTPEENYALFVHLRPLDSETLLAQADGAPGPSARPTMTWTLHSETLVGEPLRLRIPPDSAAGDYRLIVGVYNPDSGQRLATAEGDGLLLERLHIE